MKNKYLAVIVLMALAPSCATKKELAYLGSLPETGGSQIFTMSIPEYRIQPRDLLYVTIKSMGPDGLLTDFLAESRGSSNANLIQGEPGAYIYGYDVDSKGDITIPSLGVLKVAGLTLEQARDNIQVSADKVFRNATAECKLLSFKYTVIGEVRSPGSFINYNNYLTIFEAIGRAGGLTEYGRRDRVLVVRSGDGGTIAYRLNLQDKNLLNEEAYFLLPNDVVIIEENRKRIFNLNLPTYSFVLTTLTSAITTTILLINYLQK